MFCEVWKFETAWLRVAHEVTTDDPPEARVAIYDIQERYLLGCGYSAVDADRRHLVRLAVLQAREAL